MVTVRDLNDCVPVFEEDVEYVFTMDENDETATFTIKATDEDVTTEFSTVYYPPLQTIVPFTIDKDTGIISVDCNGLAIEECIDFETTPSYTFSARAADNEGGSSSI